MMTFNDAIKAIQSFSMDEKQEIQLLLKQYIREERRDNIYDNFQSAQSRSKKEN